MEKSLQTILTKKLPVILLLVLMAMAGQSQNLTLTGKITGNKDSLLGGEVLILDVKDAKLIKVSPFVNGVLHVPGIHVTNFVLKIAAHGYPDTSITVNITQQTADYDIGAIRLAHFNNLSGVTVFARTPISKKSDEGTILNVENTVLASSSNTNELLTRSPGVVASGNTLQIFGKGEALIYLNGKQILYERIASIPVNLVKQVEIITNPSAKYDAKGRAVINIITKKSTEEGWKAVITQHFTAARHFMSTSAVNLSYAKKKLSLSGDLSVLTGTDWFNNTISSSANYSGDVYTNYNYYEANTKQPHIANYKLGMGYEINKKSDISIQYDGLDGLKRSGMSTSARIVVPNSPATFISTFNDGSTRNSNNSINANYNRKLDAAGSTLFIGGQYNKFKTRVYDQIAEDVAKGGSARKAYRVNDGRNSIDLFTMQFDVVKKLKNARRIEIGGKYSSVVNDGSVIFKSKKDLNDELTAFPELSNSFLYQERIPAAYFQFADNSRSKLSFSFGARAEMSIVKGTSRKLNKVVLDSNYVNLFPNAKVSYTINPDWSVAASYSRRINRPQYQSIDPFVWYQDSLTSFQGNTRLTPELVNSIEALLTFKSFGLKLGYAFSKNVLRAVLVTGNTGPNSFIFTIDNLRRFKQYSATLEFPYDTKYWSSYNMISYNLNQFYDDRPQYKMSMPVTPMWYIYLYQQFKIPKWFNIDLTAEYTSSQSDAITSRHPLYQVTTGLSRSFMNNKLTLRFLFNDMLRTQRWWGERAFGNIYATYDQRFNTHYARLTATYRFGKLKKSNYKNKSVNDDQFNRIKR